MEITTREILNPTAAELALIDEAFMVDSVLVLHAENNQISYTITPVPPYSKRYHPQGEAETPYPGETQTTAFLAYANGQKAGRVVLRQSWNRYAYIDDICVDASLRRMGIGKLLLERAEDWARRNDLPGLMLETQNTNAAACRLYASCGFELRGFDTHLYKGLQPETDEIALYWYKTFR